MVQVDVVKDQHKNIKKETEDEEVDMVVKDDYVMTKLGTGP